MSVDDPERARLERAVLDGMSAVPSAFLEVIVRAPDCPWNGAAVAEKKLRQALGEELPRLRAELERATERCRELWQGSGDHRPGWAQALARMQLLRDQVIRAERADRGRHA